MEMAIDFLRERASRRRQKQSRIADEGIVSCLLRKLRIGALVEVNSETDFVAK